ncbi:MAG TPA: hypothetical protein PKD00_00475 [Burkholderiales bacterium]|nr:hypothetical protein [Burkholderiales bacterium]
MKRLFFIGVLLLAIQSIFAQENWAIIDGKTYNKQEFDSLRTVLSDKPIGVKRKSVVEWSGKQGSCLCVEFYALTVAGINLHRDCGDITSVHYFSGSGKIYLKRDNQILSEYLVFDPGNNSPVNDLTNKILIFEIGCDNFLQGLKPWDTYPDGTSIK